jgi:hypothetical protein
MSCLISMGASAQRIEKIKSRCLVGTAGQDCVRLLGDRGATSKYFLENPMLRRLACCRGLLIRVWGVSEALEAFATTCRAWRPVTTHARNDGEDFTAARPPEGSSAKMQSRLGLRLLGLALGFSVYSQPILSGQVSFGFSTTLKPLDSRLLRACHALQHVPAEGQHRVWRAGLHRLQQKHHVGIGTFRGFDRLRRRRTRAQHVGITEAAQNRAPKSGQRYIERSNALT